MLFRSVTDDENDITVVIYRQDQNEEVSVSETEHRGLNYFNLTKTLKKVIALTATTEQ